MEWTELDKIGQDWTELDFGLVSCILSKPIKTLGKSSFALK